MSTTTHSDSSETGSLTSIVSPVIPVTPNNSHTSAPSRMGPATASLASSQTTGRSSVFLPSAPPPTPAEIGVPLPTTMSVGIKKNTQPPKALHVLPSHHNIGAPAAGVDLTKKKAKFYMDGYETEEEGVLSPPSVPPRPGLLRQSVVRPQPAARSIVVARVTKLSPPFARPNQAPIAEASNEDEEEAETERTDSDEWASEYSEDGCDEDEQEERRIREQELLRKRQQEEYHRQLFAKKEFVQRDPSMITDPNGIGPIRRAGLSMLFHPELNHLQHHPPQRAPPDTEQPLGPNRNRSAVELRQGHHSPQSASRRPTDTGGPGAANGKKAIPRPYSLIKSKSSVAVPVLAGNQPPEMVQRSPSAHSGSSSIPQASLAMATDNLGGLTNGAVTNNVQLTARPELGHQRHRSRLGGKPDNVEYSDDEETDEDRKDGEGHKAGGGSSGLIKRAEQERGLDRLGMAGEGATKAIEVQPTHRQEPVALPLSPRTTRRNMLANEMTESVRRNLLWERQMRTQSLGIRALDPKNAVTNKDLPINDVEDPQPPLEEGDSGQTTRQKVGSGKGKVADTAVAGILHRANGASGSKTKAYKNFSKGFHRTGW